MITMSKPRVLTCQKGFTLIELLVAISIASIIVGVISAAIYSSMTGFNHLTEKQSVQEQARLTTEHIASTVRKKAFAEIKDTTNHTVLLFNNSNTDYIQYKYENNAITMDLKDNTLQQSMVLAKGLTNTSFTVEPSGSEFKITLNLVFEGEDIEPYTYKSTLYTKNWSE